MKKQVTNEESLLNPSSQKTLGFWALLAFWAFTIGASAFVAWQQYSLKEEKEKLSNILIKLEGEVARLMEKEGYDRQKALLNGQEILAKAKKYRVEWSQVYQDVMALEAKKIAFYNFNAGRDKKFNVNGVAESLPSVSSLIKALKDDPRFEDPFVSQIAEVRKDEKKAYTFALSFTYLETQK